MTVVELAPGGLPEERARLAELENQCREQREAMRALQEQLADQRRQLILHLEDRAAAAWRGGPAPREDRLISQLFSRSGPGGKPPAYYLEGERRPWWLVALRQPFNVTRWTILRRVQRRRRKRA